jgi:NAD+ kinase
MKIKNVLLLYKKSTFKHHFQKHRASAPLSRTEQVFVARFKGTHDAHYRSLDAIGNALKAQGVPFDMVPRGQPVDYSRYDVVITVGGDGTFLEGARSVTRQYILGVNSDPQWSVGRFCAVTADTFAPLWQRMCSGRMKTLSLNRMRLLFESSGETVYALNDILACHQNPAAMSRYCIRIRGKGEEHNSSGLWIATAAGSTGALRSAGGTVMPLTSRKLQYRVREIFRGRAPRCRFTAGVVSSQTGIHLISLMKEGVIYIDGSHERRLFRFGEQVRVQSSSRCLRYVAG